MHLVYTYCNATTKESQCIEQSGGQTAIGGWRDGLVRLKWSSKDVDEVKKNSCPLLTP